ncbi:NAD(P)H-hydrate epimerase [Neobacillus niacini]|uniref:NAD(P)H-hydrate epimerase n=1 Tax=Neobacillus niacini TaxID=86668 RepID=UPI002FFE23C8
MFVAGQKEMQKMDQYTIEELGLPGVVLMENAGARVVEEILKSSVDSNPKVIILAGSGNNGGDGFVITRRLFDQGLHPQMWLLADHKRIRGDAKLNLVETY